MNCSDILTFLPGVNIPFDITAGKGPIIADPIRTMEVRPHACALSWVLCCDTRTRRAAPAVAVGALAATVSEAPAAPFILPIVALVVGRMPALDLKAMTCCPVWLTAANHPVLSSHCLPLSLYRVWTR